MPHDKAMINSNIPPEKLGKNRLLSLAMVLQDIQNEIDNKLATNEVEVVTLKPYSTNEYFWSRDDCFWTGDEEGGEYTYSTHALRTTRLEILEYLRSEGVITGIYNGSVDKNIFKEIDNFNNYVEDVPYYFIQVHEPKFSSYYSNVISLVQPYLGADIKKPIVKENSEPNTHNSTSEESSEKLTAIKLYTDKDEYSISLRLVQKTLKLYVDGNKMSVSVASFKSKEANNFKACKFLTTHKRRPLTKEQLGIKDAQTKVKDLAKTMGISGPIRKQFYEFNTENKTVLLNDNVKISKDDLENLINYCNTHFS